jgi:hypothetical protein
VKKTYHGSCHCGAVRFECELDLAEGTSKCNCSICTKTRFWKAIARADAFRLLQGEEALEDYQFGGNAIHHHFCRCCGVKPFGSGEMEALGGKFYAVNVACPGRRNGRRARPGARHSRRRPERQMGAGPRRDALPLTFGFGKSSSARPAGAR